MSDHADAVGRDARTGRQGSLPCHLRREGRVPAVIYGNNEDPVGIHVEERALMKALATPGTS